MKLYFATAIGFLCLSTGLLSMFASMQTIVRDSGESDANSNTIATEYNPPGTGSPYNGGTRFHEQPTSIIDV